MSQWHNEHPDLVGTPADPWYVHEGYRRAHEQVERERRVRARIPDVDRRVALAIDGTHDCVDCGARQPAEPRHNACRFCGGELVEAPTP